MAVSPLVVWTVPIFARTDLEPGGEPNMYMQNFRCRVTNTSSTKKLGQGQVPVPCRDDPSKCVTGPKQMIAWNQAEGNNVGNIGFSPAYNMRLGYHPGAQNDIFVDSTDTEEVEEPAAASSSAVPSPATSQEAESSSVEVVPATSSLSAPASTVSESAVVQPTETTPAREGHSECSSKKARRRRRARAARAAARL